MTEQIQKTDTQNREIEEVFQELDTIAEKLESGDTSLEDSFRLYKKGMELLKYPTSVFPIRSCSAAASLP